MILHRCGRRFGRDRGTKDDKRYAQREPNVTLWWRVCGEGCWGFSEFRGASRSFLEQIGLFIHLIFLRLRARRGKYEKCHY